MSGKPATALQSTKASPLGSGKSSQMEFKTNLMKVSEEFVGRISSKKPIIDTHTPQLVPGQTLIGADSAGVVLIDDSLNDFVHIGQRSNRIPRSRCR